MSDVPQDDRTTEGDGPGAEGAMDLLAEHVPLALLLDLAAADGPASEEILRTEGVPDDAWWEPEASNASDGGAPADDAAAAGGPADPGEPTA
ncbi:hypothetical protein [Cellulomonas sp. ATA003]|uniref:hypothetical protein n=1 Tax=Cellulomonas sp. ATA003 TaxID=3073064 RepID=UPI0028735A5F|nr:hypothetical protein [Cellulomonas sp. ATA003]WNB86682.1 hypothetical protein REH70_05505 [Cellulomonas sp. ATA003]